MKKLFLALTAAAVLATGSNAFAALDFQGMGSYYGTVHIKGTGVASGLDGTYNAGWVKIDVGSGTIQTMCIDVGDSAGDNASATFISLALAPDAWAGPMGVAAANTIKLLWGTYAAGANNNTEAAALQIAIWKAIDQAMGTYSLTFSGNATAINRADFMLANLGTTPADLIAITGGTQDFIVPVPEPTTIIAGALLLLPFGASTIRILRRRQVA